jgi:Asp/Glu/hydantoin racemase
LAGSETIIIDTRTLVINPEQVEHVREQLNDVLSVVAGETRMAALQTRKQADMLENELEAALKEVQKIKQGLK